MPYKKRPKDDLSIHEKREIIAICADFKKRAIEIERGTRREAVLERYRIFFF